MNIRKVFQISCLGLLFCLAGTTLEAQTPWTTGGNASTPNCFIGTTTPTPLVMKTDGTERLTVDAVGIVKIASLASAGTGIVVARADGSLGKAGDPGGLPMNCSLVFWDGDGNAVYPDCFIGTTNAMPFRTFTNGLERMRVTPDGNVVVQGVDAKAAFQVFDNNGITFNRQDVSVTDVHRSIGFNLYQIGAAQYHYQAGSAAKMEYHANAGLLQLSVAPVQAADGAANFPLGIQIDKFGTVGMGMLPSNGYALSVAGVTKISQANNANNFVSVSHDGTDARMEAVGGVGRLALVAPTGTVNIQQTANPNNFVSIGHNGTNGIVETGGSGNAKLQVNMQSAKTVQFGGDILVANHIGVGTTNFMEGNREYKLNVNGQIRAKAAHIYPAWADYVFAKDYSLMPLNDVAQYIASNGHLPGMPTADEVAADGIDVGEIQTKTLEKVEELTLYLLEMKRENEALRDEVAALRKEILK